MRIRRVVQVLEAMIKKDLFDLDMDNEKPKDNRRRFYDGITAQDTVKIGGKEIHVIKSAEEYSRYARRFGIPNSWVLDRSVESAFGGGCGVVFIDDETGEPQAYSPPRRYFQVDVKV